MKLDELKNVLCHMYGFDMTRKGRKRELVYAKKVFIALSHNYGYRWADILKVINLQHDNCIFHYKSFGDIKTIDLNNYNACIDYFKLPMLKYSSVQAIDGNERIIEISNKLGSLSRRDLRYFDDVVLAKFLKKLQDEADIKAGTFSGNRVPIN